MTLVRTLIKILGTVCETHEIDQWTQMAYRTGTGTGTARVGTDYSSKAVCGYFERRQSSDIVVPFTRISVSISTT